MAIANDAVAAGLTRICRRCLALSRREARNKIFISYRQDDSAAWAVVLRDALAPRFGSNRIYLDKDVQIAGDWKKKILLGLESSKVVLIPIGPRWLNAVNKDGRRRLEMEGDVHRWEVAMALATPDITVIPICVERAAIPSAEELGDDLRTLPELQWRELSPDAARREVDVLRIVADIERATGWSSRSLVDNSSSWLNRLIMIGSGFVVTLFVATAAEQVLGLEPLQVGEKVSIILGAFGLFIFLRNLIRRKRRDQ